MSKLEELIDRRYEKAKQIYPNVTRDDVAVLVYSLSEMASAIFEQAEKEESKEEVKVLETETV